MEHVYCWGPHFHWFWLIPPLFFVLMLVFACRMFRRVGIRRSGAGRRVGWQPFGCCGFDPSRSEPGSDLTPSQILDRRYASGEITKEQFIQLKRDLDENSSSS